jgi:hypothetical protein
MPKSTRPSNSNLEKLLNHNGHVEDFFDKFPQIVYKATRDELIELANGIGDQVGRVRKRGQIQLGKFD